jgi:hypothetical protein
MPVHILHEKATVAQFADMLVDHTTMIKVVVDVRRSLLAGGGDMHADSEQVLLDRGSAQDDLWGANWYPDDQRIEYESLINIRPRLGNRSIVLQDEALRQKVAAVIHAMLGGVK